MTGSRKWRDDLRDPTASGDAPSKMVAVSHGGLRRRNALLRTAGVKSAMEPVPSSPRRTLVKPFKKLLRYMCRTTRTVPQGGGERRVRTNKILKYVLRDKSVATLFTPGRTRISLKRGLAAPNPNNLISCQRRFYSSLRGGRGKSRGKSQVLGHTESPEAESIFMPFADM